MTKEEITVQASNADTIKYDNIIKSNIKHPKLIAPILKAVVPEYKSYSIDEVVDFIVKDSITDDPVDDVSVLANVMDTESSSMTEKLIRYDSHFKAINPTLSNSKITIYLHIDLELQNEYKPSNPSYPIAKRAIYYGAREISSQLGVLTEKTNYNDLEKVYSIWICNDGVPKYLQNTITSYQITKQDLFGEAPELETDFDLMSVIIIRRGDGNQDEEIFDYLNAFYASDIDRICKYVNIKDNDGDEEGALGMVEGLGQSIWNKGHEAGLTEGKLLSIINFYTGGLISLVDAANAAEMSPDSFTKLLESRQQT